MSYLMINISSGRAKDAEVKELLFKSPQTFNQNVRIWAPKFWHLWMSVCPAKTSVPLSSPNPRPVVSLSSWGWKISGFIFLSMMIGKSLDCLIWAVQNVGYFTWFWEFYPHEALERTRIVFCLAARDKAEFLFYGLLSLASRRSKC